MVLLLLLFEYWYVVLLVDCVGDFEWVYEIVVEGFE